MKNSDRILAISAIFVSACALAVSVYQTRILSMEKDAGVWPYVRVDAHWQKSKYTLQIGNDGIGPALIQEVMYTWKDTSFSRIQDFTNYLIAKDSLLAAEIKEYNYSNIESYGTALKAGESRDIVIFDNISKMAIQRTLTYFRDVNIEIEYCSIYKKCWLNKNNEIIEK